MRPYFVKSFSLLAISCLDTFLLAAKLQGTCQRCIFE